MPESKMPKFEKSSESVIQLFGEVTQGLECERKKMFGYPCIFHKGNMVAGTFGSLIMFRLNPQDHDALKSKYREIRDFSPMPGRNSKGSLAIEALESNRTTLASPPISSKFRLQGEFT